MTNGQQLQLSDLLKDPRWLPHRLDYERRLVTFGYFSRDALSRASFLDTRIENAATAWTQFNYDELLAAAAQTVVGHRKPGFILHTSYCCSTLLSRALDRAGHGLALKEPEIIMGLSNAYRMAPNQTERDALAPIRDLLLSLLARSHSGTEKVVIKPTNAANNLSSVLSALGVPIVVLYGDLRRFLASVIKKGDPCKTLIRQIYRVYAMDNMGVSIIPQRDALALTDLQIAALVWRHQIEMFNAVIQNSPTVRSLDFQQLLSHPCETLQAAAEHLGLEDGNTDWNQVARGPLFHNDAKDNTRAYDAEKREEEERDLLQQHAEAIAMIENWVFNLPLWNTKTKTLPSPLTG